MLEPKTFQIPLDRNVSSSKNKKGRGLKHERHQHGTDFILDVSSNGGHGLKTYEIRKFPCRRWYRFPELEDKDESELLFPKEIAIPAFRRGPPRKSPQHS